MTWRVQSIEDETRWVEDDDTGWDGDERSMIEVGAAVEAQESYPLTPTGPLYKTSGLDDEMGVFLAALFELPGPVEVTGTPPTLPGISETDPGVVQ